MFVTDIYILLEAYVLRVYRGAGKWVVEENECKLDTTVYKEL